MVQNYLMLIFRAIQYAGPMKSKGAAGLALYLALGSLGFHAQRVCATIQILHGLGEGGALVNGLAVHTVGQCMIAFERRLGFNFDKYIPASGLKGRVIDGVKDADRVQR